jgi:hypothetical protein
MLKNKALLEVKKDERVYQFYLSPESSLGEAFDVMNEMRAYIIERMVELEKAQKEQQEQAAKKQAEEQKPE